MPDTASSAGDKATRSATGSSERAAGPSPAAKPAPGATIEGASVALRGVCRHYGRVAALDGLDLDVRAGEALGLLGPNGAGKTTLMNVLSGILRAHRGTVDIAGLGGPRRRAVRRLVGLAPQAASLYGELSAAENLRFFCRLQGVARRDVADRVEAGLSLAGLAERRDDRAGTFSGGMAKRLSLACAVVHGPRLLLLDEPTAGVDPQSRRHLMDTIARLRGRGMTVVCSTHLLDEAERLCDRVAIIDRGRVLDVDTPQALNDRHGGQDLHDLMLHLTGTELRD